MVDDKPIAGLEFVKRTYESEVAEMRRPFNFRMKSRPWSAYCALAGGQEGTTRKISTRTFFRAS